MVLLLLALIAAVQSQTASRDIPAPGRARCAISGRITEQGSGRPLPRAIIRLATSNHRLEAIADADGRYEFTNLEPGEYALWATPGDLLATDLPQAYAEMRPLKWYQQPQPNVVLMPGEVTTNLNIALARALAIEGRVLDPWDEPMANVDVRVSYADGTSVDTRGAVWSDDRGGFRLYGLAPGRYRVCAEPRGRTPEDRWRFVRTCHLASTSESNAADVMLDAEDASGVDIRIQRSTTYSVSGSVLDAAGAPADGAVIGAERDDHSVGANATSRGGQFVLTGLTPGRYGLWASIGGPENAGDKRPPAREREFGYTTIVNRCRVENVTRGAAVILEPSSLLMRCRPRIT
jgi:protocatechuate 3,4-dioxygenase beta subunit